MLRKLLQYELGASMLRWDFLAPVAFARNDENELAAKDSHTLNTASGVEASRGRCGRI
jgi:hypothetical protein